MQALVKDVHESTVTVSFENKWVPKHMTCVVKIVSHSDLHGFSLQYKHTCCKLIYNFMNSEGDIVLVSYAIMKKEKYKM